MGLWCTVPLIGAFVYAKKKGEPSMLYNQTFVMIDTTIAASPLYIG